MRHLLLVALLFVLAGSSVQALTESEPPQGPNLAVLLERGDLDGAEAALRRHLAAVDDPEARHLLAVVLSRQGRLAEAEKEWLAALAVRPDFFEARQNLARLYLLLEQEDRAYPELRTAAGQGPLERDLAMKLAVLARARGEVEIAKQQLRSVIDRFDSVRASLLLGRVFAEEGQPLVALEALGEALDRAPNSEEVLRTYARTALEHGEPVAAILALEPLTRMASWNAEYPHLMGVARLQVGDTAGAVESLHRARELDGRRSTTLVALGLALNGQKRYAEAIEAFLAALRLDPENMEAVAALAEAEASLSHLEQAEAHAGRVLATSPGHGTASLALGLVRMRQSRFEEAVELFGAATEADPGSPKVHYQLSLALARAGRRDESKRQLELYRKALRDFEARLDELGPEIGASRGGM